MLEPMAQVFRVARLTRPAEPATGDQRDGGDGVDQVLAVFDPVALQPDDPDVAPPPPTSARRGWWPSTVVNGHREHYGDFVDHADPTLSADVYAWQSADPTRPRLAILGPLVADMPGELLDNRARLLTEILLYLLTRPDHAAGREQLEDALWAGNPAPTASLRTSLMRLRRWLGTRPDRIDWIPDAYPHGIYQLADGVLLDWHLIQRLGDRAQRRGEQGHTDRRTALTLVRGQAMHPIADTSRYRRPYTWIGDSDINPGRIIATITDLAHQLATYSLDVGDTTTTRWAVHQAWLADPDRTYDDLWLDLHRRRTPRRQHRRRRPAPHPAVPTARRRGPRRPAPQALRPHPPTPRRRDR